jgi:hypothetical protein
MIILFVTTVLFGFANADALDQFKVEQDAGAEWHYVGKTVPDPKAKSIRWNGHIYYELKKPVDEIEVKVD